MVTTTETGLHLTQSTPCEDSMLKASMLCAKAVLDRLQSQLKHLRSETSPTPCTASDHPPIKKLLAQLLKVHHTLHRTLALHAQSQQHSNNPPLLNTNTTTSEDASARLLQACVTAAQAIPGAQDLVQQLNTPQQLATHVESNLQDALNKELASIQSEPCVICSPQDHNVQGQVLGGRCPLPEMSEQQVQTLRRVVHQLRQAEVDVDLQAALAAEVDHLVDTSDFTEENFAYGSTAFNSWRQVFKHPDVHAAVCSIMTHKPGNGGDDDDDDDDGGTGYNVMVWGSSLGWLVLYTHLSTGWRCQGYELLECLVAKARQVAQNNELKSGDVEFVHADLMESSLHDVGVLVMTNQCWDRALLQRISSKLCSELVDGAVVIEYTGALRSCPRLTCLAVIKVEVSWNHQQPMHVWVANTSDKAGTCEADKGTLETL